MQTDDGAKNAVENYFSTTPASTKAVSATIRNDLNSEIENKTVASDVVTAMSDPEIQAGNTISSATALRLTGMAVLGAFLCGSLLL